METKKIIKESVYLIGSFPDPEKTREVLNLAGYEIQKPGGLSFVASKAVCFAGESPSGIAYKLARLLKKKILNLAELEKANARKANERREAVVDFVARAVVNKKVVFDREDPRIEEFLFITGEVGVLWRPEAVDPTDENPFGLSQDPVRRFYMYKSERDGYLLGVQGGDEEYYRSSGEEEIDPDCFFEIVKDTDIKQYLTNVEDQGK